MITMNTDILIVGAGSGGISAAYSAAKNAPDKKVMLIEAQSVIGGTSTAGGVNGWEPGCVGKSQLHRVLYEGLVKKNKAHLCRYHNVNHGLFLTAYVDKLENAKYSDSFRRKNDCRLIFDAVAMEMEIRRVLYSFKNLTVVTNCAMHDARVCDGRIQSVVAFDDMTEEIYEITADLFIDATAEILLSRISGCKSERSFNGLNGISQMYVIEPKECNGVDKIPEWVLDTEAVEWIKKKTPDTIFNSYTDGRINVNTLCTLDGTEYLAMGKLAKKNAIARTYMIWNELQKNYNMDGYRLSYMFPMLGIREGYRLIGKYVLGADELTKGHTGQKLNSHFIAVADHAIDVHKNGGGRLEELSDYYGVPYECALTNEVENLAVASRGISLTHTAAASCRLQRTIMQVGESVGKAAANAKKSFYEMDIFETI